MSFGDLYTVQPGQGNPPGLPPVDLPTVDAPPRRVPKVSLTVSGPTKQDEGIWGSHEDFRPGEGSAQKESDEGIWSSLPDHSPETEKAAKSTNFRDVGAGEAFARSAGQGATFGLEPAIEGVAAAGRKGNPDFVNPQIRAELAKHGLEPTDPLGSLTALVRGLGKLGYEHLIARAAGEGTADYTKAREEAQKALDVGREKHPIASFAGEMAGALAVPVPGLAAAAAPARIARGAAFGAAGGAAYGAGSGISKGEDVGAIAKDALLGGGLGAATGGAFAGVLGPRAPKGAATSGERAAETARGLKAPLPRGVTSDSRTVQNTTATLRQIPVLGPRIGEAVEATQHAAGNRVGDIASEMAGGVSGRATADAIARPALQGVIDANRAAADANYNALRSAIDADRRYTMPRTQQALADIRQARTAAGWAKPSQGLEQFENVASGASFNGAHRARVDARDAGNGLVPHPGYSAADYNRLTRAMTADLRQIVAQAARGTNGRPVTGVERGAAVAAFDKAEKEFGVLADQNGVLQRLLNAKGQAPIEKLLGAAREKGGDVPLLAKLRGSMKADDFNMIGGILLTELGHNPATGEFSLAKFATGLSKISAPAKGILFSPQHLKNIEDIAGMGLHIKSALKESSSSHSASFLVFLDLAKDAALLGADVMSGGLGLGTAAGVGTSAAVGMLAKWLGSPAKVSSMAAWSRARAGMLGHPTPARLAAFNIATRNLSHTLGVPVESVLERLAAPVVGGRTKDEEPKVEGPGR